MSRSVPSNAFSGAPFTVPGFRRTSANVFSQTLFLELESVEALLCWSGLQIMVPKSYMRLWNLNMDGSIQSRN